MPVNGLAERVAAEEYHPTPKTVLPETPRQQQTDSTPKPRNLSFITAVSGAFTAIALILSVRILLLLSVIGAFLLGQAALVAQNTYSLWVLGIFCFFTVPVLVYLDIQTRSRH